MNKANYFQRVNSDLLDRIPLNSKTILEVGCGSGALGAAFKCRQPDVHYIGIETMKEPAIEASQVIDKVFHANVEDKSFQLPDLPELDCLIYGDVLEHLINPWACIQNQSRLLSNDGVLLACIPNVQHWSVLLELMQGHWPLRDEGLFDRTHLRWFTRDSIEKMIEQAGLHMYDCHPRIFQSEKAKQFNNHLAPSLKSLGLNEEAFRQGSEPLQYVIRAGKKPRKPLHIDILQTLKNFQSHADVRLIEPTKNLTSLPNVTVSSGTKCILKPNKATPRIVIWQRPLLNRTAAHIKDLQKLIHSGHLIIADIDYNPYYEGWSEQNFLSFRGVHAIQASTEKVADAIREHNPEVRVFPNNLATLHPAKPKKNPKERLRLFFGSLNREQDWEPWIDTLNSIFKSDPKAWEVVVVHDKQFYTQLKLPNEQIQFTPTCDIKTYRKLLRSCDIAYLPLANTKFNLYKSDLSAIQAAGSGLAILASNVMYEETVKKGLPAALFNNANELTQHLKNWQNQPDRARELGEHGRHWVKKNRMQAHLIKGQEQWFRGLWERREKLTQMVLKREPLIRLT